MTLADDIQGLIAFLNARLDEDEAAAKAAKPGQWSVDAEPLNGWRVLNSPDWKTATLVAWSPGPMGSGSPGRNEPTAAHIARHDPARVLREVMAKRAILAEHDVSRDPCDAHDATLESVPCGTVLHLAAIYSGHPGYRQEWAP